MSSVLKQFPRIVIFLAGVAAGAITLQRRKPGMDPETLDELRRSLAGLDSRLQAKQTADEARFAQVEAKLEEHATRLADVPSTSQIVAAMEQLLSKTMSSLDQRLTTQAESIEILRTTVAQTDGLLERVLESIDSLQSYNETRDYSEDPLLSRPGL